MGNWKPSTIEAAISEIEESKLVLPVIQRNLVWNEAKMCLLLDTLLKRESFGGIMTIDEEKGSEPLFAYRNFTKDGIPLTSSADPKLLQGHGLVIDGQQRLQTFYITLRGSLDGKVAYFDIYSDPLRRFDFEFSIGQTTLPSAADEELDDSRKRATHWVKVSKLFDRLKETNDEDQVADEYCVINNIPPEFENKAKKCIKAFYKAIFSDKAIGFCSIKMNQTLGSQQNRQSIVELFQRLNDGGTKLSAYDLIASKLKGFDWRMESFLSDALQQSNLPSLDQDNLLKTFFVLQNNPQREIGDISHADAKFVAENSSRIMASINATAKFLKLSKIDTYYASTSASFVPLMIIIHWCFNQSDDPKIIDSLFDKYDTNDANYSEIKKWLFMSLLNATFKARGSGWIPHKTGLKKLLFPAVKMIKKPFDAEALFNVYRTHPVSFSTEYSTDFMTANFDFLMHLLYGSAASIRKNDIDHIHSKTSLEGIPDLKNTQNCIYNFQLLDFATNRGVKNGKPLHEWIGNHVTNKEQYIKTHLIPSDEALWRPENYDLFIAARKLLVIEKLTSVVAP